MDISSLSFILYIIIPIVIYWALPKQYQWISLLLYSIVFYFLNAVPYTFVYFAVSVATVFFSTLYFSRENVSESRKKLVLIATLVVNIGLLAVLKYTNFAIHTWNILFGGFGYTKSTVSWPASLAISFYTLQIVSYLLDCYWGLVTPEKNILKVALFTGYFPQMISGPISRYSDIGTQLFEEHRFDYNRATMGMKRIAWGLVKKLAISNRLAIIVDYMWNNPQAYSGTFIWIAAVGYIFQLYTDFSGCMDILFGISECFGIKLPENFRAPFLSKTIQEFWRRWHITLGTWLRDYVMNPLQKSKMMRNIGEKSKKAFGKKKGRKVPVYLSMLALWLAMGLWHGNSWKYIIGEGLWFWLVIVLSQMLTPAFDKWKTALKINEDSFAWKAFQVVRTLLIYAFGMLFFRAASFTDACMRIKSGLTFKISLAPIVELLKHIYGNIGILGCIIMLIAFILMVVIDKYIYNDIDFFEKLKEKNMAVRWGVYILLVALIVLSAGVQPQAFAYAQF